MLWLLWRANTKKVMFQHKFDRKTLPSITDVVCYVRTREVVITVIFELWFKCGVAEKNRQMFAEKFVCGFEWAEKKRNFNLTGNNFTDYSTPPEKLYITMCENFETFNSCFEKENVWKYFRNLINVHEETFESDKRVNIWCHWPALDGWISPSWLWSCKSHVYFYFSTSFVLNWMN